MITRDQYFIFKGVEKDHSPEQEANAVELLLRVNELLTALNWAYPIDADTGTSISGSKGGSGDGGFRDVFSKTGAPHSSHREGKAVDVFDPNNELDALLTDELLEAYGLYREHPDDTEGWCHLTTRAPHSGHRTFHP